MATAAEGSNRLSDRSKRRRQGDSDFNKVSNFSVYADRIDFAIFSRVFYASGASRAGDGILGSSRSLESV